jgi:hypothetical protein
MQLSRSVVALALVGMLAAACGGGSPTQAPAGATQNPAGVTEAPGATQSGGGGGGGGSGQFGSAQFQVTGPLETSGTYDFSPVGSIFGGSAGTVLNFVSPGDAGAVLSILIDPTGKVAASYLSGAGQVPGAECTTSDWDIQATSGKGKFDCTAQMTITSSGAAVQGGRITGEFTAHT